MTLEQQLNAKCDNLAKAAIDRTIRTGVRQGQKYLLPSVSAALFVNGVKLTSSIENTVRFGLGKEEANRFLVHEPKAKWTQEQFDQVDWERLHNCLDPKPDTYKMWLSKQHTNFCASRVQVARYAGEQVEDEEGNPLPTTTDTSYPNCGARNERAAHLCVCPDEDRTRLFQEEVGKLEEWMHQRDNTDEELAYWIPKYLLLRGSRKFAELGAMSPGMREIAISQDLIGWRNFTEGRISRLIYRRQHFHLATSTTSYLNGEDWVKQFISKLLRITHSQWIYRNLSLHDQVKGHLRLKQRINVLEQIETLVDLDPREIPEDSRFLLEFDHDRLCKSDLETQLYWVRAVKAARRAGRRKASYTRRVRQAKAAATRRLSNRQRLGITDVERQIRVDALMNGSAGDERLAQAILTSTFQSRPHPSTQELNERSRKRPRMKENDTGEQRPGVP